jgi:hypothetical protein
MLLERERAGVVEALERLGGLQAQEPRPPFLALWTRVAGFDRSELVAALHDRTAVRGLLMRATLHTVSAGDFPALRAAVQPVMEAAFKGVNARITGGVDPAEVAPAARELLEERPRPFDEVRERLAERFPDVNPRGLGYAARTHLPLVMVPTEDAWAFPRSADFTPAEGWLTEATPPKEPTRALLRRYLGAFGPAAAADAQAWSGLGGLAAELDAMRDDLVTFRDERGRELFDLPDAPRPDDDPPAPARLLPDFDSLVLAHDDRSRVIADEHRPLVTTKNLRVKATFLVDGTVAGTWALKRSGKKATATLSPFGRLAARAKKELTTEAEALLAFAEPDAVTHVVTIDT